jgi:hypothetical protein
MTFPVDNARRIVTLAAAWAIGAVVAQLLYTQWVGGSNPSSPTNFSSMKKIILLLAVVLASVLPLLAQAEKIKGKAKDLKRSIEAGQTNKVAAPINPPAPRPR